MRDELGWRQFNRLRPVHQVLIRRALASIALLLATVAPAWAALDVAVGHFNTTTNVATTQVEVNISPAFTPKCLIFWVGRRTDTSNAVGSATAGFGVGFATSTSARNSVAAMAVDNNATSDVQSIRANAAAVSVAAASGIDGQLDFVSFDADGFTLVIDDAFSASFTVNYIALGGSDVTNCTVGSFTTSTGAGDVSVTGVGFQPDTVWLLDATFTATDPTTTSALNLSVGVAAGAGDPNDAVTAIFEPTDGADPMDTKRYGRAGESWASFATTGTINGRGSVTAWGADGFTFNKVEAVTNKTIYYLAIKGPQFVVGNALTQTDTSTDSSTGALGFTPSLVAVGSVNGAADATDTPRDHLEISLGAATSTTVSRVLAMLDEDNVATSETASAIEFGNTIAPVLLNISTADAIEGRMKIQSFADPILFRMDDADPAQSFFWFWVVGPAATTRTGGSYFWGLGR